jgi:peptidyl-prolyl cis-trans isomerase D
MLQTFRNHLVGWFSKILIGLISLAFALFGIQYYLVSSRANQSLATVNGEKITTADLTAAYNRNRNKLLNQYGTSLRLTTELQEQLRQQALNDLILRAVIYQGVKKAGFAESPLAVQAVIEQMPAFQVDGKFSPERFQHLLYNLSYTENSFYQDLAQTLTVGQLSEGVTQSAFALPNEIDRAYEVSEQKRDFKYLMLPVEEFEQGIVVNDTNIKSYYDAHTKEYQSEAQVSVDYVELNIEAIKAKQSVTDLEVQDYYQNNQSAFASPVRWQVAKVLVPIGAQAKAAEVEAAKARVDLLSKQFSQEQKLPTDVKVQWITAAKDTTDLVKLFATMKVGQVSPVQQKKEGLIVYKLLAIEEPKPQPLNAVVTQVKEALLKQKAEHEFTTRSDQLSELAFTHPDSLAPVAEAIGAPIKSTGLFTRHGAQEGLEASPKLVSAAFSDEVLQQASNSTPVDLSKGRLVVLRLKSSQPAHILPLASVKEKIVAILKRQQAQVVMAKVATTIVDKLRSNNNADELLKAHHLVWRQQSSATRQQAGVSREVLALAFREPEPKAKSFTYDSTMLPKGDYAIVSVEKVIPAQVKAMTAEQRESFRNSLALNYGAQDFNIYVKELRDKAKVKKLTKQNSSGSAPDVADDY